MCSVLLKKLHLQDKIIEAFPKCTANQCLADLVMVRQGTARRAYRSMNQNAVYIMSDSFPGEEIWAACGFVLIVHVMMTRSSIPSLRKWEVSP